MGGLWHKAAQSFYPSILYSKSRFAFRRRLYDNGKAMESHCYSMVA